VELQRELELFAQDDAEERALMDNEPYPMGSTELAQEQQPQQEWGDWAQNDQ